MAVTVRERDGYWTTRAVIMLHDLERLNLEICIDESSRTGFGNSRSRIWKNEGIQDETKPFPPPRHTLNINVLYKMGFLTSERDNPKQTLGSSYKYALVSQNRMVPIGKEDEIVTVLLLWTGADGDCLSPQADDAADFSAAWTSFCTIPSFGL